MAKLRAVVHANEDKITVAYRELIENVGVAGWREAFGEHIKWISHCFKAALIISLAVCLYYCGVTIKESINSGYTDEVSDMAGLDSLPFSNVTVCAQLYFNQSYVMENVYVPPKLLRQYLAATGETLQEFYRQFTLFLSVIVRPRLFSSTQVTFFSKIVQANPGMSDYTEFAHSATPVCEKVLRKCSFNGQQFDCCQWAIKSIDDDGICYLITLNFDADNAEPRQSTLLQTQPGPDGGLALEVAVQTEDFPFLDDDIQNGFRVYVNPLPFSFAQSPVAAPHGAETFVRVTPVKYLSAQNCAPHGKLSMLGEEYLYHDPQGFSCMIRAGRRMIRKYTQCDAPLYTHRPNVTYVCSPTIMYFGAQDFSAAGELKGGGQVLPGAWNIQRQAEQEYRMVFSSKARCLSHCQYWTYDSSASFTYFEKAIANRSQNAMHSIIRVYYAELGYRQHQEAKEMTAYLTFCNVGAYFMLYLGMSVVSFFDVLFYVSQYAIFRGLRAKRNKVSPTKTEVISLKPIKISQKAVA